MSLYSLSTSTLLLLLPMTEPNQNPKFMSAYWSAFQGAQQGGGEENGSGEAKYLAQPSCHSPLRERHNLKL